MTAIDRHTTDRWVRAALAAGVVAPAVFVLTFAVDGWLRADYDPASMFVSELSIGPGGWVQEANFVLTGLLLVVFAVGVRRAQHPGRAATVTAVTVAVMGACLAGSGFANTDHAVLFTQLSGEGRVHGLLGAVFFLGVLVAPWAAAVATEPDAGGRAWRRLTVAVTVVLLAATALLKLSELSTSGLFAEKGLIQRFDLVVFMVWLAAFAMRLGRTTAAPRA